MAAEVPEVQLALVVSVGQPMEQLLSLLVGQAEDGQIEPPPVMELEVKLEIVCFLMNSFPEIFSFFIFTYFKVILFCYISYKNL
ncbi:hypothetical protein DN53_02615 [Flagellimonas olearia]|uniref:Uncharacterized protein n=1 Tax=Flagellimonas olearia TaxID=552546 RepID=A0A444VR24_9FLAO|nr:hypothetical protein DN53_02615 [Allomuricauda olearia]